MEVLKVCRKCKQDKPEGAFSYKNKAKGIRHGHCKQCQSEFKRSFYQKDKSSYKAAVKVSNAVIVERNRRYLWDFLLSHPCVECGEDNPIKLEFDHLRDKTRCVSQLVSAKVSIKKIEEEIEKCEVVCANCHRVRTAQRAGWYSDYLQADLAQHGRASA